MFSLYFLIFCLFSLRLSILVIFPLSLTLFLFLYSPPISSLLSPFSLSPLLNPLIPSVFLSLVFLLYLSLFLSIVDIELYVPPSFSLSITVSHFSPFSPSSTGLFLCHDCSFYLYSLFISSSLFFPPLISPSIMASISFLFYLAPLSRQFSPPISLSNSLSLALFPQAHLFS